MTRAHQLEASLSALRRSGMLDTLEARLGQAERVSSVTSSFSSSYARTESPAVVTKKV